MLSKTIIANWKMNPNSYSKAIDLVNFYIKHIDLIKNKLIIAPPAIYTAMLNEFIFKNNHPISLSAQDICWEQSGAFTGEISAEMLYNLGCLFAIIGHSERRTYNHETDDLITKKFLRALQVGLTPIVCIGETRLQYDAGEEAIQHHLDQQLDGILQQAHSDSKIKEFFIAYEPVWAIGTGISADVQYISKICEYLRAKFVSFKTKKINIKILYGGSVNTANAQSILQLPNIDGALIGGASLNAEQFAQICQTPRVD